MPLPATIFLNPRGRQALCCNGVGISRPILSAHVLVHTSWFRRHVVPSCCPHVSQRGNTLPPPPCDVVLCVSTPSPGPPRPRPFCQALLHRERSCLGSPPYKAERLPTPPGLIGEPSNGRRPEDHGRVNDRVRLLQELRSEK